MSKETILKRRCKQELYDLYAHHLEEDKQERFDEVKESDPYLNQIVEDVVHYVTYDLPLEDLILEAIHGEKHVGR